MRGSLKMKKATIKAVSSIVGGLILFTIVFFIFQSWPSTSEATMTEREAERIASEQFQGEVISVEFDDGRYEIEIEGEDNRYELKLDPETAEIIELKEKTNPVQVAEVEETRDQEADIEKASAAESFDSEPVSESISESNNNVVISAIKAMEIAREKAPNSTLLDFEFDRDDGKYYYEIELETDDQEIELEIDAYTGEIIVYSYEQLDDQRKGNSDLITMEDVHQIALSEEPEAVIKEIQLDEDDGRYYYEIEMETGKYEIELDIDASTGKITDLEYDD